MKLEGFLLDECVPSGIHELTSEKYLHLLDISPNGVPDEIVFAEAKKRNRLVITKDYGFMFNTILNNEQIVFQTHDGKRILIGGILLEENYNTFSVGKITKYLLKNDKIIIP